MLINRIIKYVFIVLIMTASNNLVLAKNNDERGNVPVSRQNWNFIAYLDDEKIGYHNFEVVHNDEETESRFDIGRSLRYELNEETIQ